MHITKDIEMFTSDLFVLMLYIGQQLVSWSKSLGIVANTNKLPFAVKLRLLGDRSPFPYSFLHS